MGAFKNQLVADQVELGDRLPAPKPANPKVVHPSRKSWRKAQLEYQKRIKRMTRELYLTAMVYLGIGALLGAFITYVVVTF